MSAVATVVRNLEQMCNQVGTHRADDSMPAALNVGQKFLLGCIRVYQLVLSPWIGRQCRFYPTCSHYAAEAINRHGSVKGLQLAICRLTKCHPFHQGGVDLVPDRPTKLAQSNQ